MVVSSSKTAANSLVYVCLCLCDVEFRGQLLGARRSMLAVQIDSTERVDWKFSYPRARRLADSSSVPGEQFLGLSALQLPAST